MDSFIYFLTFLFAILMLCKSDSIGKKFGVMSFPDKLRKFHTKSIPQVGGIIFFITFSFMTILNYQIIFEILNNFTGYNNLRNSFFVIALAALFFLGLIDDRQNLQALIKFLFLALISYILLNSIPGYEIIYLKFSFYKNIDLFNYGKLIFIFIFLFFINAINMFDGINLQSASFFLIVWTYISSYLGFDVIIAFNIVFLLMFSFFNYKNHLFLGDCGVYVLSFFTFIYLLKVYTTKTIVTTDEILVLVLFPFVDCCRVFFVRLLKKRNPLMADREHIHHIMLQNFSHKVTLLTIVIGSSIPIILYKTLNLGFFITFVSFLLYYFLLLSLKKILNNI